MYDNLIHGVSPGTIVGLFMNWQLVSTVAALYAPAFVSRLAEIGNDSARWLAKSLRKTC